MEGCFKGCLNLIYTSDGSSLTTCILTWATLKFSQLARGLQKLHCRVGDGQGIALHHSGLEDHCCWGRHPHLCLQRLPGEHVFCKAALHPATCISARNVVHKARMDQARLHAWL